MNKNILSKVLVIIILLILVINNISYAINITKIDLEKSLKKIFLNTIEIEVISKAEVIPGEGVTIEGDDSFEFSSSVTYHKKDELTLTDSKIILKDKNSDGSEEVTELEYSIEDNKFKVKTEVQLDEDMGFEILAAIFEQSELITRSYLAIADLVGIDLALASQYYSEVSAEEGTSEKLEGIGEITEEEVEEEVIALIETKEFKQESTIYPDLLFTNVLEINLEELSKLTEENLKDELYTTIKIIDSSEEKPENNTVNNAIDNKVNNTTNNQVNNKVNNIVNNTSNNKVNNIVNNTTNNKVNNVTTNKVNNTDNTLSNKIIPAAGGKTVYFIIMSMITVSLLVYAKIRKYDDVK